VNKEKDCLNEIIKKVKNYDWLNQISNNHIHASGLVYDIQKILWRYLLDEDPSKRDYRYPIFWDILEENLEKNTNESSTKIIFNLYEENPEPLQYGLVKKTVDLDNLTEEDYNLLQSHFLLMNNRFIIHTLKGIRKNKEGKIEIEMIRLEEVSK